MQKPPHSWVFCHSPLCKSGDGAKPRNLLKKPENQFSGVSIT